MEVLSLFPRYLLKGSLEPCLLRALQQQARELVAYPGSAPDASAKLAGQLTLQRELGSHDPSVAE